MNLLDMIHYAVSALRQRSVRSWLTVLGIVVGITSVIVLVGLVQGLKDDVKSELEGFGPRTVVVIPLNVEEAGFGGSSSFSPTTGKLFVKDYTRLKRLVEIDLIAKVITGRATVQYKTKQVDASIFAIEPNVFKQTVGTLEINQGRFLFSADQKAAVIGNDFAEDTFDKKVELGSELIIGQGKYKVVGILKKTGNTVAQVDNVIYIPFKEGEHIFGDSLVDGELSAIRIQLKENTDVDEATERIESVMLASHRTTKDKKDFSLITPKFINQQVENITSVLTLFLGAIAGISLIVGGIGIANTMFMAVMERRKEIGVLKSIGATQSQILNIFLVESSIIGLAGGALGLLMGVTLIQLIRVLANLPAAVYLEVAIGAVLFSALVGIIFGTVPAKQAAELDPVDALRWI